MSRACSPIRACCTGSTARLIRRACPIHLAAARARSALLDSGGGFPVQVISNAADSPDAVTRQAEDS